MSSLFFIIFTLSYLHGRAYRQIGKLFRSSASIWTGFV